MKVKLIILSILCFGSVSCLSTSNVRILFCGRADNDLYKVLKRTNFQVVRFDSPLMAAKNADGGDALIVVADKYPEKRVYIKPEAWSLIKNKYLKIYVEYPQSLPGLTLKDSIVKNNLERVVVTSSRFRKKLKPMDILGINDCHIIPVKVDSPLIVLGKVAGFDKAVYGLTDVKTYPVLFQEKNMTVALTKLSDFATGRYEPEDRWQIVWTYILSQLTGKADLQLNHWIDFVHPTYSENEKLPANAKKKSVYKGVQWYFRAHLLIDSNWRDWAAKYQGDGLKPVGPPVNRDWPSGNGSLGIIEGPTSSINFDGTQKYRYWVRGDDQGEAAYALAAAGAVFGKPRYNKTSDRLLKFLFYDSNLRSEEARNPNSPVYGLIGWAATHPGVFYGDDNARCMLGVIGASAYLQTSEWDKNVLKNILANFRTTGKEGFRGNRLQEKDILENGWKYYWDRDFVNRHPHFESWLWACYLWLYDKTGYQPLLEKTKIAIRLTMKGYPDKWKWTNGMQQERARMILPLAWLVRVDGNPIHRKWLDKIVTDLLSYQVSCGAIREELGTSGSGSFEPPKSNAAYGKGEAPLIFKNGDPVADMLYTTNFAFFGLNEAYHVTRNERYGKALKKLSDFLTRIQVSSTKYANVDGAWFRAFDYRNWSYWASNADAGWGAWATLTGWIQSWIVTTQVLVMKDTSYWELTQGSKIADYMPQVLDVMFSQE